MKSTYKRLARDRQLTKKQINYYLRRPCVARDVVKTMVRGESIMRQARHLIDSMFTKSEQQLINRQLDKIDQHVH